MKVISTYEVFKPTDVELIFGNKTLTPIEENINANQVGWRETNKYWVDDSNFVWKSFKAFLLDYQRYILKLQRSLNKDLIKGPTYRDFFRRTLKDCSPEKKALKRGFS